MATTYSNSSPTLSWRDRLLGIPIMDRYLFVELLSPFLFGVGIFTTLGVSLDNLFYLVNQVIDKGLPIATALQVMLLNIPQFIAYSLPISALLSTLLTFSRLSSDSELVALKSCGVTVYRMIVPVMVFCVLLTGILFLFNESIVPAANYQAKTTLNEALKRGDRDFREEDILYQEFEKVLRPNGREGEMMSRLFYAKEFNGDQMKGLTILDFTRGELNQIISAKAAIWDEQTSVWNFYDGTIYVISADGSFRNIIKFTEQTLQIPRGPLDLAQESRDYAEMNIAQSLDYLKLVEQSGDVDKIRELRVRIQQKYALPFTCIVFGLVGASLGAQLRRTGRATAFAISILLVFTYYLIAFLMSALAQVGVIPILVGAWVPNLAGLGAGLFLLYRASR